MNESVTVINNKKDLNINRNGLIASKMNRDEVSKTSFN